MGHCMWKVSQSTAISKISFLFLIFKFCIRMHVLVNVKVINLSIQHRGEKGQNQRILLKKKTHTGKRREQPFGWNLPK